MHRCIELAGLASGDVAPNPMVGAVLVYQDKIIGEGYHQKYGKAHAEVNCIAAVKKGDEDLISQSTLYVSLEPCSHFGKTPPCANLIIEKKIQRVIVGCRDPFVQVNGKGIERLQAAGVEVIVGILEDACKELNKRFFTFHTQHRPYIILKWAQTADGKIGVSKPPLTPLTGENHTQPSPEEDHLIDITSKFSKGEFYWEADPATYGQLKQFALIHRAKPTNAETTLWQHLRGKALKSFKFRRQHIIGNYIADFVCLSKRLIIEIDGLHHQMPEHKMDHDARTTWLRMKNYEVIRFTNNEVVFNTNHVLHRILEKLNEITPSPKKIFRKNNEFPESEGRSAGSSPVGGSRMGASGRLLVTNKYTNRLVHKWRSEEMAILVGTNTALNDDPQLNTRLWPGKNPIRVVVDMNLRLPSSLKVFDGSIPTIIFNKHQHSLPFEKAAADSLTGVHYYKVTEDASLVHQILNGLYDLGIQSILVEGGAQLLQSFIDEGAWDEARVITNEELTISKGLPAPNLYNENLVSTQTIFSDVIKTYKRNEL